MDWMIIDHRTFSALRWIPQLTSHNQRALGPPSTYIGLHQWKIIKGKMKQLQDRCAHSVDVGLKPSIRNRWK